MAQGDTCVDDDAHIVRRILAGDQDGYRHVVARYEAQVIAYLTNMLGEPELARDIAQDTFVAAYEALEQWRAEPDATLSSWLYRIATNRALNALRAQKSRGGRLPSLATLPERPISGRSLEDQVVLRDLLSSALRELAGDDAACLMLHVIAGERYAEIGDRLGLTSEAVRKRVARGLMTLRDAYHTLDAEAHR
jgi:RNA polymerase sigma-70 factor (ECF subfamily)